MTYYGRWTYKYEIAAKKGAAAAIIVHETEPAGYPFEVVRSSWSGEHFDLATPDENIGRVAVRAGSRSTRAKELFAAAGQDFDALKTAARAARLQARSARRRRASFTIDNTLRDDRLAQRGRHGCEGSDPSSRTSTSSTSRTGTTSASTTPPVDGDQIFNGALDNASGMAALLELARRHSRRCRRRRSDRSFSSPSPPKSRGCWARSTTPQHPLYPLDEDARRHQHRRHERLGAHEARS